MANSLGTWRQQTVCAPQQLLRLGNVEGISPVTAATVSVNPSTAEIGTLTDGLDLFEAYRMLKDFVQLKPGDVVVQNGANSGVGQAVIQLARAWDVRTVNIIRNKPNFDEVKSNLEELGADLVIAEDQIRTPETSARIKELGPAPRLGLNCVGGKSATNVARLTSDHAHLVTYGGMSKEPIILPTSLFIFKDLTCHGFWMTRWYASHSPAERASMVEEIFELVRQGKFKEPWHEKTVWRENETQSEDEVRGSAMEALRKATDGSGKGKQILVMS
ncbi:hypothetical protein HK104_003341 [Borealophlyctis nickersoniae]|nr:hypothetical protein HK104_003341 [Borealophlyctis nickersoniae]